MRISGRTIRVLNKTQRRYGASCTVRETSRAATDGSESDGRADVKRDEIKMRVAREKHVWTVDLEVPTMPLGGKRPSTEASWRCNIMIRSGALTRCTFSPTFGRELVYENRANLICE